MSLHRSADRFAQADHHLTVALEEWRLETANQLRLVQRGFEELVAEMELPGGLFSNAIADAPRIGPKIRRLRHERTDLRSALERLSQRLDREERATPEERADRMTDLRQEVRLAVARLTNHEHRMLAVAHEAYGVDLGGPVG